jgi:hypothetical protein
MLIQTLNSFCPLFSVIHFHQPFIIGFGVNFEFPSEGKRVLGANEKRTEKCIFRFFFALRTESRLTSLLIDLIEKMHSKRFGEERHERQKARQHLEAYSD